MKAWHVPTLVRRALSRNNESESYWKCVRELHIRGSEEVYLAASALCAKNNQSKILGANILGQLGSPARPFRDSSLEVLWAMLVTEKSPPVLNAILVAIGHLQENSDTRKIKTITGLADHRNETVRRGVVFALLARKDRLSISALIRLSRDKSSGVRDWATFGLSSMVDVDTPALRDALIERLDDPDEDTRCEAMVGLAIRKDSRVLGKLKKELESHTPMALAFVAVSELGDRSLLPLVKRHKDSISDDTNSGWVLEVNEAYARLSN